MVAMLLLLAAGLSEESAKQLVPRADLSGLDDARRGAFYEIAKDVFNYAGCEGTLAKCLAADEKDPHAVRMAALVKQLVLEGFPPQVAIKGLEDYYASFEPRARQPVNANNCIILGK